jgi:hypothetical protein
MEYQALLCFKKANDVKGADTAQACIFEEKGRYCQSTGNYEGFKRNLQSAVDFFLKVGLVCSAANNLERLGKFEDAASKSSSREKPIAPLTEDRYMAPGETVRKGSISLPEGQAFCKSVHLLSFERPIR